MDWEDRKKMLANKRRDFNDRRANSTKKLKRTRMTSQNRLMTDYEIWPAELHILQRIANFMDGIWTPTKVSKKLEAGEKITTRFGAVYSLIPISAK